MKTLQCKYCLSIGSKTTTNFILKSKDFSAAISSALIKIYCNVDSCGNINHFGQFNLRLAITKANRLILI